MDPHTGSMVLTESKKGSSKGCDDHTWKVRISSLQNGQIDLHTGSMVSTKYCKERIVQAVRRHHVEGAFALQMSLIIVDRICETGDAQTVLVCSLDRFGNLRRQVKGIPMGDPNSPGMCIGSCAWMEIEWMQSLSEGHEETFP